MKKILSIIIPTYNMEKYLDKCLSSLIVANKEMIKQIEVFVVIDGAIDRSSEIAHSYQAKYPETFFVIDKENGNYGSCINCALKEVTGKYVKVLDADDCFDTASFSSFINEIMDINADAIFSGYIVVDEKDNEITKYRRELKMNSLLNWSEVKQSLISGKHLAMHEITYRTSILREMKYWQTEGISYTDQEWIFYPMTNVETFYYSNQYVYKYLVGRSGQTMDPTVMQRGVAAHITIANRMISYYKNFNSRVAEANAYVKNNLLWLLNHIYGICLLSQSHGVELNKLNDFDINIQQEIPELYINISNFSTIVVGKINCHFVKKWQKLKNKNKLPLSLELLLMFRKVRNHFQEHVQSLS